MAFCLGCLVWICCFRNRGIGARRGGTPSAAAFNTARLSSGGLMSSMRFRSEMALGTGGGVVDLNKAVSAAPPPVLMVAAKSTGNLVYPQTHSPQMPQQYQPSSGRAQQPYLQQTQQPQPPQLPPPPSATWNLQPVCCPPPPPQWMPPQQPPPRSQSQGQMPSGGLGCNYQPPPDTSDSHTLTRVDKSCLLTSGVAIQLV